jgi:hypothetical protein
MVSAADTSRSMQQVLHDVALRLPAN